MDIDKIPDNYCLTVAEAVELLRREFGISYRPRTLRDYARDGILPFFKVNPRNPKEVLRIRAGDLRKHIWSQQNAALNRAAGGRR